MRRLTIQSVVALQGIVAVVSVVALILSLTSLGSRIDEIQASRHAGAIDSCYLLRQLVFDAVPKHHLGLGAREFLAITPLHDCRAYAHHVITDHHQ